MNILLKFDHGSHILRVPDGYVWDLHKVYWDFFEWIEDQPENITNFGIAYNETDFLRYINDVVLSESKETAYFLPKTKNMKVHRKLSF